MHYKNGFSLIELVIVIVLVVLVFLSAGNMIDLGLKTINRGFRDYSVQSNLRVSAQTCLSKIRYAKPIYLIPESSFRSDNLDEGWDYFGIEKITHNGAPAEQIAEYVWDEANDEHIGRIIAPPVRNVTYSLVFSKDSGVYDNNLVNFRFDGYLKDNASNPYMVIDGKSLANNSMHVINYSTPSDKAVAIAYRGKNYSDTGGLGGDDYAGHVAILLNCPAAMDYDIEGRWPAVGPKRIDILKNSAKEMFDTLAAYDEIRVSLIPFSNSANDPQPFRNTKLEHDELISRIEALTVGGGRNTGDAIRRAYYQLKDHAPPGNAKNYLILVLDGEATFASLNVKADDYYYTLPWTDDFLMDDGNLVCPNSISSYGNMIIGRDVNILSLQVFGNGNMGFGDKYVQITAQTFFPNTNYAKPYLIALTKGINPGYDPFFSEDLSFDYYRFQQLKSRLRVTASNVYTAADSNALSAAFSAIVKDIAMELWSLNGPKL